MTNEPPPEPADEALDTLLAPLRSAEPDEAARSANRRAAAAALAEGRASPWWGRTVAVPLPVALATAAALLAAVVLPRGPAPEPVRETNRATGSSSNGQETPPVESIALTPPHASYYESQRYVAGIGYIDREIRFGPEE